MTDAISSATAATSSAASSLKSDAITTATKKQLEALKIDTTNITTETEAQTAIKTAQKKAELAAATASTQTADIQDTVTISQAALNASQN